MDLNQQAWSQAESFESATGMPTEDDFSKFLDLENIDLSIPPFDSADAGSSQALHDAPTSSMDRTSVTSALQSQFAQQHLANKNHTTIPMAVDHTHGSPAGLGFPSQYNQVMSPFNGYQDQPYNSQMRIPPTPNSVEMHPDTVRYLQQLYLQSGQTMDHRHFHTAKNDLASFTPLISPEVPPHDSPYSYVPEFTVPGAYLSPLTSPALGPQVKGHSRDLHGGSRTADSSIAASPADGDFGGLEDGDERPRKTRKKSTVPRSTGPTPRQPSTARGRKRRSTLSMDIPSKDVHTMLTDAQQRNGRTQSNNLPQQSLPASTATSAVNTASPESNSETSMAPPPKPGSVQASPAIPAQTRSHTGAKAGMTTSSQFSPATPASLMKLSHLRKTNAKGAAQPAGEDGSPEFGDLGSSFEDLRLPEAAKPAMSPSHTRHSSMQPARSLPRVDTNIRPATGNPTSAKDSPLLSAVSSPGGRRTSDLPKLARNSRKRNGGSAVLISPALRPKISPSIKPLLPEGANITADTHALLLASKSNYQNILEGTHPPGVTYPSELSTNLTSKRTSHKLAEQGRRNRINTALQEMQNLLPSPSPSLDAKPADADDSSTPSTATAAASAASAAPTTTTAATPATPLTEPKTPQTSAQQSNSKAATVEQAIDYIKALKGTVESRDAECEALRAQVEQLQARLDEVGAAKAE